MTETTVVTTYLCVVPELTPSRYKEGSAGYPIPGFDVKLTNLDENGHGELSVSGRHLFMGYLNDEKNTKDVIDEYGRYRTGDMGYQDSDGFYFITGRKKGTTINSIHTFSYM